ncbi:MAG: hypothetical protein E7515_07730 [Ruminococcaceae bacterium]|jgi:hypothetical protein|nr:hypothetical protein [Oscillospiraceae bacterium]
MGTTILIKYLIIGLIALCGVAVVGGVVRFIKRAGRSAEAQVVKELVNLVNENGLDFVSEPEHPRLISNMNRIYLPQILKDFPDFDWDEIRKMLDNEICEKYSDKDDFEIEETVISRYEKTGNKKLIHCESSVSCTENGVKKYFCIQSVLTYTNLKKLDGNGEETPQALVCPSCGAPLTRRADGEIICEYCSTVVVGEKIWTVTSIKEK